MPFYTRKPGSASALVDPTKPANTFGQGNPPNKNIFYIKTCKTNTTKFNLSAASVLRFKGVHVNFWVLIAHLICVHGCSCVCVFFLAATQFLNFQKHCWCVCLFFCYKNCVLVTSCRSRSDCSSTGWLFLNDSWRLQNPKLLAKTKFEGYFLK